MSTKNEIATAIPATSERSRKRLGTGVRAGGLLDDLSSPFRRPMDIPPHTPPREYEEGL